MGKKIGVLSWVLGAVLMILPLSVVAEEKPFGYVEIIQGFMEFPGLNANGGVYWETLHYGQPAMGVSATVLRFPTLCDLRVGYLTHDANLWGGASDWKAWMFAPTIRFEQLGLKPVEALGKLELSFFFGASDRFPIGGIGVVHHF